MVLACALMGYPKKKKPDCLTGYAALQPALLKNIN
jgi:hypothetical protein